VKIITVPAVTDANGNVACATFSGFPSVFPETAFSTSSYPDTTYYDTETFIVTQYSTLPGGSSFLTPYTTYTTTTTYSYTDTIETYIPTAFYTTTVTDEPTFSYANQYAEAYFGNSNDTEPTGVVISLATPFIYLPSRGIDGATQEVGNLCAQSPGGSIDFGYVPQTLVDFLVANPAYSSQYPGLASCLPGGPAVSSVETCSEPAPESESEFLPLIQLEINLMLSQLREGILPHQLSLLSLLPTSRLHQRSFNPPQDLVQLLNRLHQLHFLSQRHPQLLNLLFLQQ
jgi:hypothetical protein